MSQRMKLSVTVEVEVVVTEHGDVLPVDPTKARTQFYEELCRVIDGFEKVYRPYFNTYKKK